MTNSVPVVHASVTAPRLNGLSVSRALHFLSLLFRPGSRPLPAPLFSLILKYGLSSSFLPAGFFLSKKARWINRLDRQKVQITRGGVFFSQQSSWQESKEWMERWAGGEATFQRPNKIRRKDGTADLSVDPIKGRTWMHYGLAELLTVVGSRSIPPSTDRGGLKFYRRLIELSRSFERSPIRGLPLSSLWNHRAVMERACNQSIAKSRWHSCSI